MFYKGYEITVEQDAIVIFEVNDDLSFTRDDISYLDNLTWVGSRDDSETLTENSLDNLKFAIDELEGA